MNSLGKYFCLLGAIAPALGASAQSLAPRNSYLLVDDRVLEKTENATLVPGVPKPSDENPLLTMDTPVEGGAGPPWFNIILDPHEKFYKAWYGRAGCCYGTSHNGLLWNKPLLDLNPDPNGAKTSLLIKDFRSAGFLRDDGESDEARVFKLLGQGKDGVQARFSEEGIKFESALAVKNLAFAPGSHTSLLRAPGKGYEAFFVQEKKGGRKPERQLMRSTSTDFATWSGPEAISGVGNPASFAVLPHAGIYLALTGIDCGAQPGKLSLAVSSDGSKWNPHGPASLRDPVQAVIPLREEIRFYYTHDNTLNLATVRADGFAGYAANAGKTASLITKPVAYPGLKLRLTADIVEGGSVAAALLDDQNREAAPPAVMETTGTNVLMNVAIPPASKTVRFKFTLKNATLYAFSFGDRTFP
ncbi:MAG: hypothetical protein ACR2OZ_17620 [Verrucomicrobiales bacterium]